MLHIALLGRYDVRLNDEPIELKLRPVQNLLAYLLLKRDKRHRREQLSGILWPDYTEASARKNLRNTVYRLRQAIGEEYLAADRSSVAFNKDADYWLDVAQLEGATAAKDIGEGIQAVGLYQGELLPGYYEDWVVVERERLQALFERQMQGLLESLNGAGRWSESQTWAEHWIAQGQAPEPAYRALMLAQAGLGDRAGISAAYQRCVVALRDEVGVEPSPETISLYQELSSGEALPGRVQSDRESKPVVSLPLQPTPFIGRKNDLSKLSALVADPTTRLVNIQGPGGIGKTRLAIEVARNQAALFLDGVYFVSFAGVDESALMAPGIAAAIDFSLKGHSQLKKSTIEYQNRQLMAFLRPKKMLLILDNLEHFSGEFSIISEILQNAPEVVILTTSRERLGLRAETNYRLGRLATQDETASGTRELAKANDAVRLFISCAERTLPGFEQTPQNLYAAATICELVGGLPLGIELAAAWVGMLSSREIADELKSNLDILSSAYHDLPERQQNMRSVFESSWNRLTPIEQEVFKRLSVFRGGFTRQAAEFVTGAKLSTLMALVNKSLIQPDYTGRYQIHELLRQYGWEKLLEAAEMALTRDRHLAFFLKLAEKSEAALEETGSTVWSNLMEIEHNNIRASLAWGLSEEGQTVDALHLAGSLVRFWSSRGYFDEGRDYLFRALATPDAQERTATRARMLHGAGHLAHMQSYYPIARPLLEESLSVYVELGPDSRLGRAEVRISLGDLELELGNFKAATSLLNEALAAMRELGNDRGTAHAIWQLGAGAYSMGDDEQAVLYYEEAVQILRQIGDRRHLDFALSGLATVMIQQGNYKKGTELEQESLAMRRTAGNRFGIAASLGNFAWMALKQDAIENAVSLLRESLTIRGEVGDLGGVAWCLEKMAGIALISGQRAPALTATAYYQRAARLFGTADALRGSVLSKIDLVDQPEYERQMALVRDKLDGLAYEHAWAEGQAMTLEQAINIGLGELAE